MNDLGLDDDDDGFINPDDDCEDDQDDDQDDDRDECMTLYTIPGTSLTYWA